MKELVLPSVNRPFVEALHQVADTARIWSVIGGFAVWRHLGESHRPTLDIDIDTAAADEAHETLVALGAPGDNDHRRVIEGVKLEIIEVLDPGPDASDLDDKNRLFVTAHWAAARLTNEVRVSCEGLEVSVPVACRVPLVACTSSPEPRCDVALQVCDGRGTPALRHFEDGSTKAAKSSTDASRRLAVR